MSETLDKIRKHTISYPVNVEAAIRDVGIRLTKNANLSDGIAGQISRLDNGRFEISSTKTDHYYRQRFTMAHELGHFVMHRSLIGEGVDDNTKYRSTVEGEFYNTNIDEMHERQANAFAAKVLIPSQLLKDHLTDNQEQNLVEVATAFQVSPSCMRWRLKNLSLYTPRFDDQ